MRQDQPVGDRSEPSRCRLTSPADFLESFQKDRSGAIAIIFALTITMLVAIVGGAVDYATWSAAKRQTMQAMDAAVLAAGRALQLGKTEAEAIQAATEYYNQNKSNRLDVDAVTFVVENNGTEVVATSNSIVKTPLMGLAGVPELAVNGTSRSVLASGSNSGTDVEISLMLDTTGSMEGSKMADLKLAAKDLISIVVWDDQSQYTSRVALAPFSEYVNVSSAHFQDITNHTPGGSGNQRTCVKERVGANRYTDKKPNGGHGYFERYTDGGTCKPTSTVVPLTSDKVALENAIDAMPTSGYTAGHLGTAWSWYLLSPDWKSIWPSSSEPKAYNLLTELNSKGQPKLRKIAILMTDGEYNREYSGDSATTQARELCTQMKATGLTLYTVGFAIDEGGEADTTMAQCATSSEHYYSADDGVELRAAFRDIALKISTLRIAE